MTESQRASHNFNKTYGSKQFSVTHFVKSNKIPLLITLGFFLVMYYVSSVHSHYWTHPDGLFYLRVGEQILTGNGKDVVLSGATPGGPILFAYLNSFIHDGFFTEKIIALLSGTGIVFISYFIMRNFVNYKIALVGQLFVAFNPRLNLLSVTALNELLPLFLIFTSLYFVTKKDLKLSTILVAGSILGISSIFRYQAVIVLLAILIFLLIRNKKIKTNLLFSILMIVSFSVPFSSTLIYNYSTYGTLIEGNFFVYLSGLSKYQTPEWHEKIQQLQVEGNSTVISAILYDFDLFLKNYVYNLFYYNSSLLFNFNLLNNISIIPIIPFLGFISVAGGLIYLLREKLGKTDFIILCGTALTTALFVFLLGDIQIHFFAIIMIPLLSICIKNIKNFEKNLLPLLILGVVFMLSVSIVPLYRSYHLFVIWMLISLMNAIFFVKVIPRVYFKIITIVKFKPSIKSAKTIMILLILVILLINGGFSYRLAQATFYYSPYEGISAEFSKLFQKDNLQLRGDEIKEITNILSKEPGIENSYLMGTNSIYSYYVNSNFIFTAFTEGPTNDTINNFITRKNWTPFEINISNIHTFPSNRLNTDIPIPDYLIYTPHTPDPITPWYPTTIPEYLKILSNSTDPRIPSNFKLIYNSNQSNTIIYKIDHEK